MWRPISHGRQGETAQCVELGSVFEAPAVQDALHLLHRLGPVWASHVDDVIARTNGPLLPAPAPRNVWDSPGRAERERVERERERERERESRRGRAGR